MTHSQLGQGECYIIGQKEVKYSKSGRIGSCQRDTEENLKDLLMAKDGTL